MRLTGVDNEPLGIVTLAEAFRLAEEANVDLVEIAPTAQPPVCRLMDYGKFKYSEQKKAHEAKLKQKIIQVKEVKFRPGTDDGDYNINPQNGSAPFRLGTRDLGSHFKGKIRRVAVFNRKLSATELANIWSNRASAD